MLDLRDLLVGESHAANTVSLPSSIGLTNAITVTPHEGNLANYLHFSAARDNTVIEICSTGGFSNDHQVINDLLQRGKLVTD